MLFQKKYIFTLLGLFFLSACSGGNISLELPSDSYENTSGDKALENRIILALGDSLTAGYGVDVSESYPSVLANILGEKGYNYEILNAGISGDTSGDVVERLSQYDTQNIDLVLLVIGGNDGLRNESLDTMKTNIISIIDFFAQKDIDVVLGGMEIPPYYGLSYSRDFKNIYFEIAKEKKGEIYFLESFLKDVGGVAQYNQSDTIHPTAEGYQIIANNIFSYLEKEKILLK